MKNANRGRRAFLRSVGAMSTFGLASRLDLLNFIAEAEAQNASDYKALVCVFMFGGNDGNNIGQRLIELRHKVVADDLLLLGPTNLSGDKQQATARFSQDTIGIAARRAE